MRGATLVLAVVLVVGWTATAIAECAWVLWVNTTVLLSGKETDSTATWEIGRAFKDRAKCAQAKHKHWQMLVQLAEDDVGPAHVNKKSGEYVTRLFDRGGHINEFLHCYPDTIDPREKKG